MVSYRGGQTMLDDGSLAVGLGIPVTWVTPTVAGVATSELLLDAGATTTVKELLKAVFTLSAEDLASAADLVKFPRSADAPEALPGTGVILSSDTAITDVFAAGVSATVDAAASNVMLFNESTDATIRSALTQFEFAASDDVRSVVIMLTCPFGTVQSGFTYGQYGLLRVWGRKS